MAKLSSAEHVSPCCIKVVFAPEAPATTGQMRVNAALTNVASYSIVGAAGISITRVELPWAQSQAYVGAPPDGGAPTEVYLITNIPAFFAGVTTVAITAFGQANLVDWLGGAIFGGPWSVTATTEVFVEPSYWQMSGWKVRELYRELGKLSPRLQLGPGQPNARSIADMIGKLADLAGGGTFGSLANSVDGPPTPEYDPTYGYAGFSFPGVPEPGVGDLLQFEGGLIPCHVDKLWGACDGVNRTFRTSISFHPFSCNVIVAPGGAESVDDGIVSSTEWFAPDNGIGRLIRLHTPPPTGAGVIAVYVPRKSIVKIGNEILAYDESNIHSGQATIYGRKQLCSDLEEHSIGDLVTDVWAASMLTRAEYNMLSFGASGRALEKIGLDAGSPREDNPALTDTDLRRMIFRTSVTMRAVPSTAYLALRYMFPRFYRRMIVGEDPRWPGCLVVWWHQGQEISPVVATSPEVEPWETWLDDVSWPDGMPMDLLYDTFWRSPITDISYDGDYFLPDGSSNPEIAPYPVVMSGPDISLTLGMPLSFIPPPVSVSDDYLAYLVRPTCLDKVLPSGIGILILDASLL